MNQKLLETIITETSSLPPVSGHASNLYREHKAALVEEVNSIMSKLIPICAWCKKIRNDEGFWSGLEEYFSTHTDAVFSHSICPECVDKME